MIYIRYIAGIYLAYFSSMPSSPICQVYTYFTTHGFVLYLLLLYILVIYYVYLKDIVICYVYLKDIHNISQGYNNNNNKGTEQAHELWSRYIPVKLVRTAYYWNKPCIYRSVSDIPVIYQEYSWYILYGLSFVYLYIPSLYIVYAQYIHCIYLVWI